MKNNIRLTEREETLLRICAKGCAITFIPGEPAVLCASVKYSAQTLRELMRHGFVASQGDPGSNVRRYVSSKRGREHLATLAEPEKYRPAERPRDPRFGVVAPARVKQA